MNRMICTVRLIGLFLMTLPHPTHAALPRDSPESPVNPLRIVLVGDSTVTEQQGWGAGFAERAGQEVRVINLARGGRSSKSYFLEGWWQKALDEKPDLLLIQFGHNDCPGKGPDRETDPAITFRDNLRRYVAEARAAGATPVLITPLTRRRFDDNDRIRSDLTAYADATKAVALETQTPLVDLHARSIDICNRLGARRCADLSPPVGADGVPDSTHLNLSGSRVFGDAVIDGLLECLPELKDQFNERAPQRKGGANAMPRVRVITVGARGYGEFATIQAAVDAAATHPSASRVVIRLTEGIYESPVRIPASAPKIAIVGPGDPSRAVITAAQSARMIGPDGHELGTFRTATMYVDAADFTATGITVENTAGPGGQALAISVSGDRCAFRNCRFLGWQDTVYLTAGRSAFLSCLVQGHCDYIFGDGLAVFQSCEIRSLAANFVTAASTPEHQPFGFVFIRCRFTDDGKSRGYYLGRPWRPHAAVAVVQCELGEGVHPEGWHDWNKPECRRTVRYVECDNSGPGSRSASRAPWSRQLPATHANGFDLSAILAGDDGWNPLDAIAALE